MSEAYREILPYLRPEPGELTWLALAASGLLLGILGCCAALSLWARFRRASHRRRFFCRAAGKAGLSGRQQRLLWRLAQRLRVRDPHLLLTSPSAFERHIGGYATHLAGSELLRRPGRKRREVLDTLAHIRRRLDFDLPRPGRSPVSTRQLTEGQILELDRVHPERSTSWRGRVARTDEGVLRLVPEAGRGVPKWLKRGAQVEGRFGMGNSPVQYCFQTQVLGEKGGEVAISHGYPLERQDDRGMFRLKTEFSVELLTLPREGEDPPDLKGLDLPSCPRLRGRAGDISGGGMRVQVTTSVDTDSWLIVHPDQKGPFPIAGVVAEIAQATRHGSRWDLHLRFVGLSSDRRDNLMGSLFAHQMKTAC